MDTKNSGSITATPMMLNDDVRVGGALGVLRQVERGHPRRDGGAEVGAEREGDRGLPVEHAGGAEAHDDADRRRRRVDHRGDEGRDQHAVDQAEEVVGLEARDDRHDLRHVAQRAQAAGHQVEAVEDQREAHAGERDVADLVVLGEHVDQREDAAEDQAERPERQRDQAVAERGADIGAHDDADRRPQPQHAGIDEADHHDGHRGARLDDAGDEGAGHQAGDRRAGDLGQQRAHLVDGERLDAVRHEFEAEHEDAQAADHRHEDVFEDVRLHRYAPEEGSLLTCRSGRGNRRKFTLRRWRTAMAHPGKGRNSSGGCDLTAGSDGNGRKRRNPNCRRRRMTG